VLVFADAQSCRAKTGQFVIDGKNNPDQRTQLVSTWPSPGGEHKCPRALEHHWYFDFTHDPGLLLTGVSDHFTVYPLAAGIANVILDGVIAG
jgi:hypothetical protein